MDEVDEDEGNMDAPAPAHDAPAEIDRTRQLRSVVCELMALDSNSGFKAPAANLFSLAGLMPLWDVQGRLDAVYADAATPYSTHIDYASSHRLGGGGRRCVRGRGAGGVGGGRHVELNVCWGARGVSAENSDMS